MKCFLGLSSDRAYKRFYPAIDPLLSWSRYLDQLESWFKENLGDDWVPSVKALHQLLFEGDAVQRMMQVTGEEGISLEDFVTWQKSVLLDMVYLQQDAFDDVDASMPRERQVESFRLVKEIAEATFAFDRRDAARDFFTRLTGTYRNWNYAATGSPDYTRLLGEIRSLIDGQKAGAKPEGEATAAG